VSASDADTAPLRGAHPVATAPFGPMPAPRAATAPMQPMPHGQPTSAAQRRYSMGVVMAVVLAAAVLGGALAAIVLRMA
jgi:hypothetical protein